MEVCHALGRKRAFVVERFAGQTARQEYSRRTLKQLVAALFVLDSRPREHGDLPVQINMLPPPIG